MGDRRDDLFARAAIAYGDFNRCPAPVLERVEPASWRAPVQEALAARRS